MELMNGSVPYSIFAFSLPLLFLILLCRHCVSESFLISRVSLRFTGLFLLLLLDLHPPATAV